MRRYDSIIVVDRYRSDIQFATAAHIYLRQSFDGFEALSQKYIYLFHPLFSFLSVSLVFN